MAIQSNFPAIRPSLLLDFANSKRLDPRITFTRASTARYYDGSTVAKAEENLFQRSQAIGTSPWQMLRTTAASQTETAPDGSSTASNVLETADTGSHAPYQSFAAVNGQAYTFSVFAKANGRDIIQLSIEATSIVYRVEFDLTGVTSTNRQGTGTATITDAGGGWYRITATATATASGTGNGQIYFCSAANTNSYAGDITKGFYLWGAQLEQRSAVTAYTATTTAPITNYVPQLLTAQNNVPRFDHDPITGESLGLLVEPQKTNSFTYSQEFDNAYWTKSNSSILTAQNIAPDGTLTAQILNEGTTATVTHGLTRSMTMTINVNYSLSVYVKNISGQYLTLAFMRSSGGGTFRGYKFDLVNLTAPVLYNTGTNFAALDASIGAVGNGWYRIQMNATMTGGVTTPLISIGMWDGVSTTFDSTTGLYQYTGTGRQMLIWGAQFTTGSGSGVERPTSYIPTSGATATRQADAASMTGTNFSSWYDAAEGTVYTQLTPAFLSEGAGASISDASANNRIRLAMTSATEQAIVTTGGSAQATLDGGEPAIDTSVRAALAYKVNDFALSLNGGAVATDTGGTIPVVSQMQIGATTTTTGFARIAKLAYYPARLTNAQLQAITG